MRGLTFLLDKRLNLRHVRGNFCITTNLITKKNLKAHTVYYSHRNGGHAPISDAPLQKLGNTLFKKNYLSFINVTVCVDIVLSQYHLIK